MGKRGLGLSPVSLAMAWNGAYEPPDGVTEEVPGQVAETRSIGDAAVPMREGVRLLADIYLPQGGWRR
ncbi:MAG: hypothetical protein O7F16_05740 [Acidobacteria bacterium]|nr:hypothetical protein [Acidobacteriota bacterium]